MPNLNILINGLSIVQWGIIFVTLLFAVIVIYRIWYYKNIILAYEDDMRKRGKASFNTFMNFFTFLIWFIVVTLIFKYV